MRRLEGTWIALGSGSADEAVVDDRDRVTVPPADPEYTLRRVWLDEPDVGRYNYGFSNRVLWPLCHRDLDLQGSFEEFYWNRYRAVNERFADAADVDVTDGREILELRPAVDWDKGRAIEWVTETAVDDSDVHRLYLGDGVSDEAAFQVVSTEGTAIRVGGRTSDTAADYQVPGPDVVAGLLHRVAGARHGEP